MIVNKEQREKQRGVRIPGCSEEIGHVVKACRCFGTGRSKYSQCFL